MSSFVPITTSLRILKFSIVERTVEHTKYHAESKPLRIFRSESFLMSKFPYLSSTKSIVHYPFKHLFYKWCSYRINLYMAFLTDSSPSHKFVSYWHTSWSHAEFTFSLESSFHILRSIIILQLCLTTENHEEEFLIRIIGKT